MAEQDSNSLHQTTLEESEEEQRLKYLEFVQVASLHALMYAAKLYNYAKENSGALQSGVDTVEGTVKTVVGPVYHKYHAVPVDVLKYVDRKVDESINNVQTRVPPTLTRAFEVAQKAPATARSVVSEVKIAGLVGTASGLAKTMYAKYEPTLVGIASGLAKTMYAKYEPAAKDLYSKYEPMAEHYTITTWRALNQLPFFPQFAQAVAPTTSYYTKKYNEAVQQAALAGSLTSSIGAC